MLKNDSVSKLVKHTPKPIAGSQGRSLSAPHCCEEGEKAAVPDGLVSEDELSASFRLNRAKFVQIAAARGVWDPEVLVNDVYLSIRMSSKSLDYINHRFKCRIISALMKQERVSAYEVSLPAEDMEQLPAPCCEEGLSDRSSELDQITMQLSVEHRQALLLHHCQGIKLGELAVRMNRSKKAVKSLLSRARKTAKRIGLRLRAGTCH